MTDMKADPETTWVRAKHFGPVIGATAAAVIMLMRFEHRMGNLENKMEDDIRTRSAERVELIGSVNGVRDELRKVFVDSVATRQAQAWIELARALNRDKFPLLVFPDLPR